MSWCRPSDHIRYEKFLTQVATNGQRRNLVNFSLEWQVGWVISKLHSRWLWEVCIPGDRNVAFKVFTSGTSVLELHCDLRIRKKPTDQGVIIDIVNTRFCALFHFSRVIFPIYWRGIVKFPNEIRCFAAGHWKVRQSNCSVCIYPRVQCLRTSSFQIPCVICTVTYPCQAHALANPASHPIQSVFILTGNES